ncbi:MAG TPA: hypothetical protein VHA52_04495 [Candidatus Babeliaceae bacterium]|nr:hypothetical protein [Candidatus Babeliaceae bacterium]
MARTKLQRRIYDIHQHINNKSPGYYNDVGLALQKGVDFDIAMQHATNLRLINKPRTK